MTRKRGKIACLARCRASSMLQEIHTGNMAIQFRVGTRCVLAYQPLRTCHHLAAHTHGLAQEHTLWDKTHVVAGEIVRNGPDSTCTAVAILENRHHPDKKTGQGWVHC